nr:uncharacterized protein LOC123755425 [Procambarus clarkii]
MSLLHSGATKQCLSSTVVPLTNVSSTVVPLTTVSSTVVPLTTVSSTVVPSRIVVLDANSRPIHGGVVRSLTEGDALTLYCIASGGRPPAQVTWWKGASLLTNTSVSVGEDGTLLASQEEGDDVVHTVGVGVGVRYVRTALIIPALTTDYAHANITCRASNNNITEPLSTTLYLELYRYIMEGRLYSLLIELHSPATSHAPPCGMSLMKDDRESGICERFYWHPENLGLSLTLQAMRHNNVTEDMMTKPHIKKSRKVDVLSLRLGEVTSSWLTLVPEAEDHGATLTCRAHNPNIPGHAVTTSTALQITFAPRVTLRLGYNLQTRPVTEGEDVYFECEVASNPPPFSITWYRNTSCTFIYRPAAPSYIDQLHFHIDQLHLHIDQLHLHIDQLHLHIDQLHLHIDQLHLHIDQLHLHIDQLHLHIDQLHLHIDQLNLYTSHDGKLMINFFCNPCRVSPCGLVGLTYDSLSLVRVTLALSPGVVRAKVHSLRDLIRFNGPPAGAAAFGGWEGVQAGIKQFKRLARGDWTIMSTVSAGDGRLGFVAPAPKGSDHAPLLIHLNDPLCSSSTSVGGYSPKPLVVTTSLSGVAPSLGVTTTLFNPLILAELSATPTTLECALFVPTRLRSKICLVLPSGLNLPVCVDGPQTVTVVEGDDVRLACRVDAKPEDDLRFTWYFNNTLDTVEVERHRIQVQPGLSYLDYTPRSSRDYGVLSCWATNTVGTQADPCQFTVLEAGPPERVEACQLVNHTGGTLEVRCSPGSDGGLPQWFVGRVFDANTHKLLVTLEEAVPRFQVGGLTPGLDYLITITAVNEKGASEPQEIDAIRLKVAEKRMGEVSSASVSPLMGAFLGLVGGFLGLLLLGVSLTLLRSYRCRCVQPGVGGRDMGVLGGLELQSPTTKTDALTPGLHSQGHAQAGPDVLISASSERVLASSTTPRARGVSSYCGEADEGAEDPQARALSGLWPTLMSSSV